MAKKKGSILKRLLAIVFIAGLAVAAYVGNIYYQNFMVSNIDTHGEETYLYILPNSNTNDVLNTLDSIGVVGDMSSLKWLAEKKNYKNGNVVSGKYKIDNTMSNNALINHLRAGNGKLHVNVIFNQIWYLEELAGALTKEIMADSADVYHWLTNADSIAKYGFNRNTIISMFIPNTYHLYWDTDTEALMARMAKEYKDFWNVERTAKLKECGLSQSEVTTLASIVYWETKIPEDKKTIAGVYMNRLRIGMPLQADPTLLFALKDKTIKRVLNVHKEVDSPYNTYKYRGLPPGPILIPPISYIDAVLNYSKHDYLYFVAKEDLSGESYFSKTYSQHLIYARRYQQALSRQGIYR